MNREAKFRVWDALNEKMYYPCDPRFDTSILFHEGGWVVYSHFTGHPEILVSSRDGGILMEYTGRMDKNGVEICEGDIVKRIAVNYAYDEIDNPSAKMFIEQISFIEYRQGGFLVNAENIKPTDRWHWESAEVISNIHEGSFEFILNSIS